MSESRDVRWFRKALDALTVEQVATIWGWLCRYLRARIEKEYP